MRKGESSIVSTKGKAATEKGKEKVSDEKATIFVDLYQDAQEQQDHAWESKYLEWLHQSWANQKPPSTSSEINEPDHDDDYDSDREPEGPW